VKLIAPQFVKPYVKTNKTDANDAEAICEAMSRPSMRFVAVKTVEQQDLQAVHRVRSSLIRERAAKANQLRGLVYEYGLVAPREISSLRRAVPQWLEDAENGLTPRFRALLSGLYGDGCSTIVYGISIERSRQSLASTSLYGDSCRSAAWAR
jgi:transposase